MAWVIILAGFDLDLHFIFYKSWYWVHEYLSVNCVSNPEIKAQSHCTSKPVWEVSEMAETQSSYVVWKGRGSNNIKIALILNDSDILTFLV